MDKTPLTYESSGVSIDAQDQAIEKFKDAVSKTHGPEVLAGVGAFGAAFQPNISGIAEPVFVSSTDSLGTKTLLHSRFNTMDYAGQDVVGCVVNDVIVSGARPLFFLDYLALNKVDPDEVSTLVKGVAKACRGINCSLIGGEIAEMNDVYQPGDFDLVGFAIGMVDKKKMIDGSQVKAGDVLIGLPSNGVHCNGFSLVRKALDSLSDDEWTRENPELGTSIKDALLKPTRCYANEMLDLANQFDVHAAAHISGGGLIDNVPRVIPSEYSTRIDRSKVAVLPVFDIIQRQGNIEKNEMWHVFNMGIGFVIAVNESDVNPVLDCCESKYGGASVIGEIAPISGDQRFEWID